MRATKISNGWSTELSPAAGGFFPVKAMWEDEEKAKPLKLGQRIRPAPRGAIFTSSGDLGQVMHLHHLGLFLLRARKLNPSGFGANPSWEQEEKHGGMHHNGSLGDLESPSFHQSPAKPRAGRRGAAACLCFQLKPRIIFFFSKKKP